MIVAGDDPVNMGDPSGDFCIDVGNADGGDLFDSNSTSGYWRFIYLTPAKPRWAGYQYEDNDVNLPIDIFDTQYNYANDSLQWYLQIAPGYGQSLFTGQEVELTFQVTVNFKEIRSYHYRPHTEDATYIFHSSLADFTYNGKGTPLRPMPGESVQVKFEGIGTITPAIVYGHEDVHIGA